MFQEKKFNRFLNIKSLYYLCGLNNNYLKTSGTSQSYIDRTENRCGSDF